MVSKEPDHLLTANANSKGALADKLPGTMTVRSVLLNRDSPDVESRLKRRRNRTHQVRFKDLEDGSSSSGNGGSAETDKSRQKPAKDGGSPRTLREPGRATVQGWSGLRGPGTDTLPGRTSVVGAVRGDMAGTIEVVAAFLARAPPHPLTPGPTRRCWTPPQANSLTLPMARRPSGSTSTAIQTSPSSGPAPSHSLGDSVGVDGDDEQDSQDECLADSRASFHRTRDERHPATIGERAAAERRAGGSRVTSKAAAGSLKTSRHSCPPVVQHGEPCCHSSVPCQDGPKRQGSVTPSLVRRRKRLNRTVSDPGKEVTYCTTPTQTESPGPSPPPSNAPRCNTQVQAEHPGSSPPLPRLAKCCATQCQAETPSPSPPPNERCSRSAAQIQSCGRQPSAPLNGKQSTAPLGNESAHLSPPLKEKRSSTHILHKSLASTPPPNASQGSNKTQQMKCPSSCPSTVQAFTTQTQTHSFCTPRPQNNTPSSTQTQYEKPSPITYKSPLADEYASQINVVPLPTPATAPPLSPRQCAKPPCPSPPKPSCTTPTSPVAPSSSTTTTISCPTSAPSVTQHPIPYYTVLAPPQSLAAEPAGPSQSATTTAQCPSQSATTTAQCPSQSATTTAQCFSQSATTTAQCHSQSATTTAQCPSRNYNNTPVSNIATCTTLSCSITSTPLITPNISPSSPPLGPAACPNANSNASRPVPPTGVAFVTQTALSCTSISYHTTTHLNGHSGHHATPPPYTTLIHTVSHCNIPSPGVAPSSSPVPKLKDVADPARPCATAIKTVPPYSSTFRAAPPYAPPSHGPCTAQDKRGVRLPPPPPPPPPPYTPRKEASVTPGPTRRPPATALGGGEEQRGGVVMDSAEHRERADSLKHGAATPPLPVTVMQGASTLPGKACSKPSCLGSAQAQLGVLHKMLCSGAGGSTRPGTPSGQRPPLPPSQQGCPGDAGPLTATQADTLRQVQEILGSLVSGARCKLDPSRVAEKLLGPNGPLHDIRSLQTQLHSLEGVLETSQNTIKVLLDVIQDLEKKEAERDGRHSYRTGQDIENCGTCRDCACIIYSVEHDFRLQEGQVVRTWKVGDPPEDLPQTSASQPTTPHQHQDSPQTTRPPATTKKNRKKCFWFL